MIPEIQKFLMKSCDDLIRFNIFWKGYVYTCECKEEGVLFGVGHES